MNLVKNDLVKVISGKYKTKTGKVLKVYPDKNRVIIEGVGMIKRHTKPSRKQPQGGIVEKEAPIHVSNLMVICKKCNQPTRVGHKYLGDGTKVRICRNAGCGEILST